MSGQHRSAILRAEIFSGESTEITCALEMTSESVFIVTEKLPPIDETVRLRLSFPRTVRPLSVSARVSQVRLSSGPGSPPGFVAEFDLDSEETRRKVSSFASRLRPGSGSAPSGRELSVLLVEDNQLIRDMFAYAVERYFRHRKGGVRLSAAASLGAAWRILDEKRAFDLAVVDHKLSDGTGASLIATLRRHGTFRAMPIVGMSAGGPDVRTAMLEAGADIFLHKPIVLKDLFYTLEFLMDASGGDRGAA